MREERKVVKLDELVLQEFLFLVKVRTVELASGFLDFF